MRGVKRRLAHWNPESEEQPRYKLPPNYPGRISVALALGAGRVAPKQVTDWQGIKNRRDLPTPGRLGWITIYADNLEWPDTTIKYDQAWIHVPGQGIYVTRWPEGVVSTHQGSAWLVWTYTGVLTYPEGGDA